MVWREGQEVRIASGYTDANKSWPVLFDQPAATTIAVSIYSGAPLILNLMKFSMKSLRRVRKTGESKFRLAKVCTILCYLKTLIIVASFLYRAKQT